MTTTACAFSMTSSRISPTYGLAPFDLACLRAWSHSMGCNPSARRKSNILFRKASSRPWTTNTDLPFVFRTAFLTFDARRGGSASLRSRSGSATHTQTCADRAGRSALLSRRQSTRLLVVHSAPPGTATYRTVKGVADAVVLINPAFEAARYSTLNDLI